MDMKRAWLLTALVAGAVACSDSPSDGSNAGSGGDEGGTSASGAGGDSGGSASAGGSGASGSSGAGSGGASGSGAAGSGSGGSHAGSGGAAGAGSGGSAGSAGGTAGSGGAGSGAGTGGDAGGPPDCDPGFHPEGSTCVPDDCAQPCAPDASECSGGNERRCEQVDGCWQWSSSVSCGALGCDGDACAALASGVTVDQWGTFEHDVVYGLASGGAGEVLAAGGVWAPLAGQTHAGSGDLVLCSRNESSADNWTRLWGSKGSDTAFAIERNAAGDIFVGGVLRGALMAGDEAPDDFIVTKWSSEGAHQWDARWGSAGGAREQVFALALGADGSIFASGVTAGDLDGTNAGVRDAFLSKLDGTGAVQWSKQWGDTTEDVATDVARDSSGNTYVVGYTDGVVGGQSTSGGRDAFVQKRGASDGAVIWTRQFGSSGADGARSVAITSGDDVLVTGFAGGGLGRSGTGGAFLGKWSADGTELWIEQWGPAGTLPWAVQLNAGGDVYVAGTAFMTIDGATNAGDGDAFLSKWTQSGNSTRARSWSRQYGTDQKEETFALAVHPDGAVYVGGSTFGAFPGFQNLGKSDFFLLRVQE